MILFEVIVAVLLASSLVVMGLVIVVGAVATVATVRCARRDHLVAEELDAVLDEIVGPRSSTPRLR